MTNNKQDRDPYVYEALGLTDERTDELIKIIFDEMESDHSITDSIKRIQYNHAKTEAERNFMLFTFGYNVRELDMRNQVTELMEELMDDEGEDITSDMGPVMMGSVDFHEDIFKDVT